MNPYKKMNLQPIILKNIVNPKKFYYYNCKNYLNLFSQNELTKFEILTLITI
jgi:hypothetical protein